MKTPYTITLVLFGIITAVGSSPGFAIMIMLFTLGIGALALIAAANLFVVLLCFLPLVLLAKRAKLLGWGLSAAALGAAVFGPAALSERRFNAIVAQETARDVAQSGVFAGKTFGGIDLMRPERLALDPRTALQPSDNCGALCQRVLHGGQFDWVRVLVKGNKEGSIRRSIMLARGDDPDCAQTQCFVYRDDQGEAADVTVDIGTTRLAKRPFAASVQRVVVNDNTQNTPTIVWRQSELRASLITSPAYLMPPFDAGWNGSSDPGYEMPRAKALRNRIDPEPIAEALGLRLAGMPTLANRVPYAKRQAPVASATKRIASLLDLGGEINETSEGEIRTWTTELERAPVLSAPQITLLMRIAQDERIAYPSQGRLFTKSAEFRAVMLPWVFETLEQRRTFKPGMMKNLLFTMSSDAFPLADLAPYTARYRALLADPPEGLSKYHLDDWRRAMLAVIGRFDFDPAPTLQEVYRAEPKRYQSIMRAICSTQPKWRAGHVPLARDIVTARLAKRPESFPRGVIQHGMKFMIFMGHKAEVAEMVKAAPWTQKERMLKSGFVSDKAKPLSAARPCY